MGKVKKIDTKYQVLQNIYQDGFISTEIDALIKEGLIDVKANVTEKGKEVASGMQVAKITNAMHETLMELKNFGDTRYRMPQTWLNLRALGYVEHDMDRGYKITQRGIDNLDVVNYSCLKTRASCFLKGLRIPVLGNGNLSSPQAFSISTFDIEVWAVPALPNSKMLLAAFRSRS